jgi:hypothetical protein
MTRSTVTLVREGPGLTPAPARYGGEARMAVCVFFLFTVLVTGATAGLPFDPASARITTAYLGEEILLEGVNTDSEVTYLCVTGPNLPPGGGRLDSPGSAVVDGDASTFTRVDVGTDNRWEYRWRTAGIGIDAGTYTVYAESAPQSRNSLTGGSYSTSTFVLIAPIGTGTTVVTTVANPPPAAASITRSPVASPSTPATTGTAAPPAAALSASAAGIALAGVCLLLRRK